MTVRPSAVIRAIRAVDSPSARFGRRAFFTAAAAALLAGCAEDEGGYQFANDPRPSPSAPTATTVVTPPPPPPTAPVAEPRALADLLRPRGAPARLFFRAGRELWTIEANGDGVRRVFAPPAGTTLVDFSPSPAGDRVAVLVRLPDGTSDVAVLTADGTAELRASNLAGAFATPVSPSAAESVDWSPQGGELVVGFDPGGLVAVPLRAGGSPQVVAEALAVGDPRWSPTGASVAFAGAAAGDGFSEIWLAKAPDAAPAATPVAPVGATPIATPVAATPVAATAIVPAESGRAVYSFAWMPDGRALVFSQGGGGGSEPTSADLWTAAVPGGKRSLLASAGAVAPVARIENVVPSPDGRAVAYTVAVPAGSGSRFDSLWVLELASRQAHRLDVAPGSVVRDIWWTSAGLVYRAEPEPEPGTPAAAQGFALFRLTGDGPPEVLFQAIEAATPSAAPAATPGADEAEPVETDAPA